MTIQEMANQLQQDYLRGAGQITQLPGQAAASTRKYYSTHKGTDIGVPVSTPIYAPSDMEIVASGMRGGYGQSLAAYNPTSNQTTYFGHLSKIPVSSGVVKAGQILGYSGGAPGTYGAGNTTGAHVDIEQSSGRTPFNYSQAISSVKRVANNGGDYVKNLINKVISQYGNRVRAVSTNEAKLKASLQPGQQIIRVKL